MSSGTRKTFPPNVDDWTPEGNFSFFFRTRNGKYYCIDANNSTGLGRKINHSKKSPNVKPIVIEKVMEKPRLFFKAIRDIMANEELLYDYGETQEDVITAHPWLG